MREVHLRVYYQSTGCGPGYASRLVVTVLEHPYDFNTLTNQWILSIYYDRHDELLRPDTDVATIDIRFCVRPCTGVARRQGACYSV